MPSRRPGILSYARTYRRALRYGSGMPPHRPGGGWRRFADPLFYLRAVIAVSSLALILIPALADGSLALARPIAAGADTCRIVHVVDGDTADIWCRKTGLERARFTGYDAPELFSPGCTAEMIAAQKAKWALRASVFGQTDLRLERGRLDRYDRRLVTLHLGETPLAADMIANGHGRPYTGEKRRPWCR